MLSPLALNDGNFQVISDEALLRRYRIEIGTLKKQLDEVHSNVKLADTKPHAENEAQGSGLSARTCGARKSKALG